MFSLPQRAGPGSQSHLGSLEPGSMPFAESPGVQAPRPFPVPEPRLSTQRFPGFLESLNPGPRTSGCFGFKGHPFLPLILHPAHTHFLVMNSRLELAPPKVSWNTKTSILDLLEATTACQVLPVAIGHQFGNLQCFVEAQRQPQCQFCDWPVP